MAPDLQYEYCFRDDGLEIIAGLDEVGRGAWAGPVAAGAVILPLQRVDLPDALAGVRDSKLCSARERERLDQVVRQVAEGVGIGMASVAEIDSLGIAPATRLAMRRALDALPSAPQALLIDYVRLREVALPQRSLVKGDRKSYSIAAAGIVAKVARDRLMTELDAEYPGYGLAAHKGYGTKYHQAALDELGPCVLHRRSFRPIRERLFPEIARPLFSLSTESTGER
ncbi:MAG: ribonuclease HII [Anaerolineae bacterium]|nr:ribonuclease HII [Anaerolineae bacterium]